MKLNSNLNCDFKAFSCYKIFKNEERKSNDPAPQGHKFPKHEPSMMQVEVF